ncbi:MAG: hypothetical protein IJU16_08720, partial [Clostridia bacterium]|nr:hypothetical protein [Clostridia bacterium]
VSGKLEGLRGEVQEVSYTFKIRLSAYEKVTAVVDTRAAGEWKLDGTYLLSFDEGALPARRVLSWFRAPSEEENIASDDGFLFQNVRDLVSQKRLFPSTLEEGEELMEENAVVYLSVNDGEGVAVVESRGSSYVVEFTYTDQRFGAVVCDCYGVGLCRHSVAALLKMQQLLSLFRDCYADQWNEHERFSAVRKDVFFSHVLKEENDVVLKL